MGLDIVKSKLLIEKFIVKRESLDMIEFNILYYEIKGNILYIEYCCCEDYQYTVNIDIWEFILFLIEEGYIIARN